MFKQRTEVLHASEMFSEFPPSEKRSVIRSILLVRNGSTSYLFRNSKDSKAETRIGDLLAVTNLLDRTWYLVEAHESGYRLFFHLNDGEMVVELAPEADLSSIADDLTRRIST
ncbi:MAG TPA: hypothetical protein VED24_04605 [Candidatus Acidoferrum sp.]|nr:hypothetical protein [Candidatus Acidoferrum sp.]